MLPYGIKNKRFATIHSHNKCSICSNSIVSKKSARQSEKDVVEEYIISCEYDDNEFCVGNHCDCSYCLGYEFEYQGNGWRFV